MLNGVLFRLTRRYIRRRFFQSVLSVLGIALGVAVGVAIDLANASASRAFELSVGSVTGRTTHQVVGTLERLSTDTYRAIRIDAGIRTSAPVIESVARALSLDNRSVRILGIDPFADAPFRDYLASEDAGAQYANALYQFIVRPNTALISDAMAADYDLKPGDTIMLQTRTQPEVEVIVVGVLYPTDDLSEQALNDLLLVDIATAQEIAGQPDTITRVDLILPEGFDLSVIERVLPLDAVLTTPSTSQDALSQMTDAFQLNLQALSLLALLVGVFLIYNTVTFSVVQRRQVIGIMRSLGTTRRQIFTLILTEALILGVVGTALGLVLGVIMGQGAVRLVARTINDLYFRVNVQGLALDPMTLVRGGVTGIAASVLAAMVPSLAATRMPPAGVMRRSSVEQDTRRMLPLIAIGAVLLGAAGVALLLLETTSIVLSFTALFMVLVGCALLTPLVLVGLMWATTPLTGRVFGVLGRMAPRAVVRSLSRTSVAVTALTLAVSVIVGVSVMISSFRTTLIDWLDVTLGADIYISPYSDDGGNIEADIDPAIVDRLAALDGVASVATSRGAQVIAPDYPDLPPVNLVVIDSDISNGSRRFAWSDAPDGDYWAALQSGQVAVSEPFAFRRDITRENNTLTLLTEQGEQEFTVFGVFYDYTADQGTVLMHEDVYHSYYDDPYLSALALYVLPEADITAVVDTLETDTLVGTGLAAQSNRTLRSNVLNIFDRTFAITIALRLLATIVAFIGILSALMALQIEHTWQYGVMRATGMTPRQLRTFTFVQTGLMGTTAGILALPVGLILALILIDVINVRSFGWTMVLNLQTQEFAQAFAVALVAALAAGVYPAWRLSRLAAAQALRSE